MTKKRDPNIDMKRVRQLLTSTVGANGAACFTKKLKGEAEFFMIEAVKARQAGADIKYARVAEILTKAYEFPISAGSVANHMKGICQCSKIRKNLKTS